MSTNTLLARHGRPFTDHERQQYGTLLDTVQYFLSKYKYLHERRLMPLVFYAEYRYYQLHNNRLTHATYTPYMHGMWSDDVRTAVHTIDPPSATIYQRGGNMKRFYAIQFNRTTSIDVGFLEQIHDETRDVTTENLRTFAKSVPMFERTNVDDTAEFNDTTVDDTRI